MAAFEKYYADRTGKPHMGAVSFFANFWSVNWGKNAELQREFQRGQQDREAAMLVAAEQRRNQRLRCGGGSSGGGSIYIGSSRGGGEMSYTPSDHDGAVGYRC